MDYTSSTTTVRRRKQHRDVQMKTLQNRRTVKLLTENGVPTYLMPKWPKILQPRYNSFYANTEMSLEGRLGAYCQLAVETKLMSRIYTSTEFCVQSEIVAMNFAWQHSEMLRLFLAGDLFLDGDIYYSVEILPFRDCDPFIFNCIMLLAGAKLDDVEVLKPLNPVPGNEAYSSYYQFRYLITKDACHPERVRHVSSEDGVTTIPDYEKRRLFERFRSYESTSVPRIAWLEAVALHASNRDDKLAATFLLKQLKPELLRQRHLHIGYKMDNGPKELVFEVRYVDMDPWLVNAMMEFCGFTLIRSEACHQMLFGGSSKISEILVYDAKKVGLLNLGW